LAHAVVSVCVAAAGVALLVLEVVHEDMHFPVPFREAVTRWRRRSRAM
jgi:hypothetical protein